MPRPAQCCRSEQAIVKMAPASDLSLRGGRRPTWRPERAARGSALGVQSREGSHDFADSLPVIRLGTARLPRRFAPRNDTSGEREVHQCPPAVELLPTGRSLSAATGPVGGGCHLTIACANRLCSTGRGMPLPYNGGYHETAAGTGRQCLPEIAPQGHFLALRAQGATAASLLAMTHQGSARCTSALLRLNYFLPGAR